MSSTDDFSSLLDKSRPRGRKTGSALPFYLLAALRSKPPSLALPFLIPRLSSCCPQQIRFGLSCSSAEGRNSWRPTRGAACLPPSSAANPPCSHDMVGNSVALSVIFVILVLVRYFLNYHRIGLWSARCIPWVRGGRTRRGRQPAGVRLPILLRRIRSRGAILPRGRRPSRRD